MGMHGLMVITVPTSFNSLLLRLEKNCTYNKKLFKIITCTRQHLDAFHYQMVPVMSGKRSSVHLGDLIPVNQLFP